MKETQRAATSKNSRRLPSIVRPPYRGRLSLDKIRNAVETASGAIENGEALEASASFAYSYWEARGGQGGSPEEDWLRAEQEEIARLAYSYWEARGGQGGSPEEDWLRAEQEVRARRAEPHRQQ